MSNVLVLVHGMGVNVDGWAAPVVDKLNTVARRYRAFSGGPAPFLLATGHTDPVLAQGIDDQVIVVPAAYDAVMRARVEEFDEQADAIVDAAGAGALPDELLTVLEGLQGAGETERNFFWTHAVDVLLYRFFALVAKPVRLAVMETVAGVLARNDTTVSVMAHSLGTAVTHDALTAMVDGREPRFAALRPPGIRLANYFAVANVSRILEKSIAGDRDVFQSPVCPISVRGPDAFVRQFWNFRHMLDPFTLPRAFEPAWLIGDDFAQVDKLLHVADFNVHGWEHYLDNPEVHVPILNALARVTGSPRVDRATFRTAVANYRAAPVPLCEHGMAWWTERTHALRRRLTDRQTVPALIAAGAQFYAVTEAAKAICRGQATIAEFADLTRRIG